MKKLFFLIVFAVFAVGQPLEIKYRGKLLKSYSLEEIKKTFPIKEIEVWEPHETKLVSFRGVEALPFLKKVYSEQWKKGDELSFSCLDGYEPTLPFERFEKYQGYIVFERVDGGAFLVENNHQNETNVPLGPFYMVWNNKNFPELKKQGGYGWPYQLTSIDLIYFKDKFKSLAPPEKANELEKKGFVAFRENCQSCHTINGQGGKKGFELNYPVSVTEYFKEEWLKKWIKNPSSIRYSTTMPGFTFESAGQEKHLEAIISYLKVMAKNKVKP